MTSTNELDGMKDAHDELFVLDNRLMLEWYPQRVIGATTGKSLLELGLAHGHSTSIIATHFSRYQVVESIGARVSVSACRR